MSEEQKKERIFNWDLEQQKYHIKWWERILLRFKKPYYGYDYGYKDQSVLVVAKKMNGKIYIVDEHRIDNLTTE